MKASRWPLYREVFTFGRSCAATSRRRDCAFAPDRALYIARSKQSSPKAISIPVAFRFSTNSAAKRLGVTGLIPVEVFTLLHPYPFETRKLVIGRDGFVGRVFDHVHQENWPGGSFFCAPAVFNGRAVSSENGSSFLGRVAARFSRAVTCWRSWIN